MDASNKKKLLVATGQMVIDNAISKFEDFDIVAVAHYRKEIDSFCSAYMPDIAIIGKKLEGNEPMTELLISIKREHPSVRIIYISPYVDIDDKEKINTLGYLVLNGIYDIFHEQKLNSRILYNLLCNPKTPDMVKYLTANIQNNESSESDIDFETNEDIQNELVDSDTFENLVVVYSVKPGTGKTFLSINTATGIAKYGIKKDGKKPKVAIIEGDFQNLSVGTILKIEDSKKNIKTVINCIKKILDDNGNLTGSDEEIFNVNETILNCFIQYKECPNLYALVGSQLTYEEIKQFDANSYSYLISVIADYFDVIIVDANSSLDHVTTAPLLYMARKCYYIMNLDYNNVRNNIRYKETMINMGIENKVNYVLNEDIVDDKNISVPVEKLAFTAKEIETNFKFKARIPEIPKTIIFNRTYEGIPIILDDSIYTERARYEILKVCNEIWPVNEKYFNSLKTRYEESSKKYGIFSFLFRKDK